MHLNLILYLLTKIYKYFYYKFIVRIANNFVIFLLNLLSDEVFFTIDFDGYMLMNC